MSYAPAAKVDAPAAWNTLLIEAIEKPGTLAECYQMFHDYSYGNQMLAYFQIKAKGLPIGPVASFNAWKALGRFVKKGEKAIVLCMPIIKKDDAGNVNGIFFIYKRNWFCLAQTEGAEYQMPPAINGWDVQKALDTLGIAQIPFAMMDGNCQGYASHGKVAINPIAAHPARTLVHEMAHVLMHQRAGEADSIDGTTLGREFKEVEAEAVAYIIGETLGFGTPEESRGYLQHWLKNMGADRIDDKAAQRIFRAADKILKAGMPEKKKKEDAE